MGRPKEHDESTRAALLAAAETLIQTHGPNAALGPRRRRCGGHHDAAVYSVFGSKDGMLEALAMRLFEMLSEAIDACTSTDDPVADIVTISLDGFRRTAVEHPSLYGLVFLRIVPDLRLGPEFSAVASGAFGRLKAHIARLEDDGRLRQLSVDDAAAAVHALTEGLATIELRGMLAGTNAEHVWRTAITSLTRGFA